MDTNLLQITLDRTLSGKKIWQIIMAVESGDRSFRWAAAKEKNPAHGPPIRPDSPFFIASIDKLLNATVALLLEEQDRLHIDDGITDYLSDEITRGLHSLNGRDYTGGITIRHLLSHSSGLPDWIEDYPRHGPSIIGEILEGGDRSLSIEDITDYVRTRLRPHFPPATGTTRPVRVRYSDTNFILLSAILESITGESLEKVHRAMLYEPLGMRHTYFHGRSEPLDPTPPPIPLRANGNTLHIPELIRSINGIYSTVDDMICFLRGLFANAIFRKEETLVRMQGQWNRFGFPLDRAALRAPGWPIEYGLGIMRFQLPRFLTPFKRLPAVIGHSGSTGCWLFRCPERDLYLSGSVDEISAGAVPYRIIPGILKNLPSALPTIGNIG